MIKFVSDLQEICSFLDLSSRFSLNKTDQHDIHVTKILLKVVLDTNNMVASSHKATPDAMKNWP